MRRRARATSRTRYRRRSRGRIYPTRYRCRCDGSFSVIPRRPCFLFAHALDQALKSVRRGAHVVQVVAHFSVALVNAFYVLGYGISAVPMRPIRQPFLEHPETHEQPHFVITLNISDTTAVVTPPKRTPAAAPHIADWNFRRAISVLS